MKAAYFDCFSGASGDMIVGALLDAGLALDALRQALTGLRLPGCSVSAERTRRAGLAGTQFTVTVEQPDQHHRGLSEILGLIRAGGLPGRSADLAETIFTRLGQAEAKVHGVGLEDVQFHEVGAVDSIVDIVSSAVGIERLGIEQVWCSPIPTGTGTVRAAHGVLPVPAPATAELLRGAPVVSGTETGEQTGELTTPTGAAILTTLAAGYGPVPDMSLEAVGYGAGTRQRAEVPNLLRVLIGSMAAEPGAETVVELSANVDDATGQMLGAAMERLLSAQALDAWCTPIYMKKSRPAWMLSALCSPADADRVEQVFFRETPTLGVRRRLCSRKRLLRRHVTVETRYGPVRVKIGTSSGGTEHVAAPEYEDCRSAAEAHGVPVREVMAAAVETYRRRPRGEAERGSPA